MLCFYHGTHDRAEIVLQIHCYQSLLYIIRGVITWIFVLYGLGQSDETLY